MTTMRMTPRKLTEAQGKRRLQFRALFRKLVLGVPPWELEEDESLWTIMEQVDRTAYFSLPALFALLMNKYSDAMTDERRHNLILEYEQLAEAERKEQEDTGRDGKR